MDDEPPVITAHEDLSILLTLDGDALDRKVASMLHQASQIEPLVAAAGMDFFRAGVAEEAFRAGGSPHP
jgi:hypothetical protein